METLIAMSFADMWWVFLLGMFFFGGLVCWNILRIYWLDTDALFDGFFKRHIIFGALCGGSGLLMMISLVFKVVEMFKG